MYVCIYMHWHTTFTIKYIYLIADHTYQIYICIFRPVVPKYSN
jgi:hypothetical protein